MSEFKGLEFLKWAGLLTMFYDHVEAFGGVALPFAASVGAFAFPFFAVALAGGMCGQPEGKRKAVARRLLVWGVIAQLVGFAIRDPLPFNVMFTLAFGLMLYGRWGAVSFGSFAKIAVIAVLATVSEFSIFGVAFVVSLLWYFENGNRVWVVLLAAFPLYVFNEGSLMSIPATLLAVWLASNGPFIPRLRGAFYPLYVVQWPLLRLV